MRPGEVRAALAGELPPALLVRGAGAWGLAVEAAGPDWRVVGRLDAPTAREVRATAYLLPPGELRVFLLDIDTATQQVQNMLLKVLEEPPGTTRFVLAAAGPVLATVASRCRQLVLGGQRPESAGDGAARAAVGTAIRAARSGQALPLAQAVRAWSKDARPGQETPHGRLLALWAAEAASGRWVQFTPDFAPGVPPGQAAQLLAELGRYRGSRLAPLVALDRVFCPG